MSSRKSNRRSILLAAWATLGVGGFVGCSLTSIPFVRVGECTSDASCNEALEAECAEYECVEATDTKGKKFFQCQAIDGEKLDGLDNDCDGLVDESDGGETPLTTVQGEEVASGLDNFTSATLADARALTQIYLQKDDGTALALAPEGGEAVPVKMMAQATTSTAVYFETRLEEGCFSADLDTTAAQSCDINQAATAAGRNIGFFAQVKSNGCSRGELRVGAIDPEEPSEFIDRGPRFRNPSFRGVATYGTPCTDNGRPACSDAKAEYSSLVEQGASSSELTEPSNAVTQNCGVSQPAIAAGGKQAFVAYLGAPLTEDVCESGPADVFGLVLHERIGDRAGEFAWADPSGDGVPELVGSTVSAQPPAIQALGTLGFLMAHPDGSGDITLTFIPQQESPPGNTGVDCPDDDCDSRDGLETDPVTGIETLANLTPSGSAEGIRMQWLTTGDDEGSLVISWVRGCAPRDNELSNVDAFAQVLRIDISSDTPEIIWEGPILSLGETRSFPLAVPSTQEFVVAGFERNGETATEDDLGGFYLLTRPLGIQAVRIAAFDGDFVAEGETIAVDPFADDPDSRPNTYRYVGAMGEGTPDEFLFKTTSSGSLFRASFDSGN